MALQVRLPALSGAGMARTTRARQSSPTNVASVPQRSPLRYPGGKTWLIPEILRWLSGRQRRVSVFIEPFAGGASASLAAVFEGLADRAVLCEKDSDIARLWRVIFEQPEDLIERIAAFKPSRANILELLEKKEGSQTDLAFRTFVQNRTSRGGILAKGASLMKNGEGGKGVASRWYPETFIRRIRSIAEISGRIDVLEGDGLTLIQLCRNERYAALFVDPPYTAAGKRAGRRLYTHNAVDHERLFELMGSVKGQFLMTYDDCPEIVGMAQKHGFDFSRVPMKNTHHAHMYELLIANA